jgi:hypothetical protein
MPLYFFPNSQCNLLQTMDLELHTVHDHMDLIQNVANSWMEDSFQDNVNLCITCARAEHES